MQKNINSTTADYNPPMDYIIQDEDIVNRAPIVTDVTIGCNEELEMLGPFEDNYISDWTTSWYNIADIFQNHEAWTYEFFSHKSHDGQNGFCWIYENYFVPNSFYHMMARSERRLYNLSYHG